MQTLPDPSLMLYQLLMWTHIITGAAALVLFWMPLSVPRGSREHVRFGQLYLIAMYFIVTTGAVMALMVLFSPEHFKADIYAQGKDPSAVTQAIRQFWSFLLFLCVLITNNIRHATRVLQVRTQIRMLRRPGYLITPVLLLLASLGLLVMAASTSSILYFAFAGLGLMNSIGTLRYCLQNSVTPKGWVTQHITNICGSGIGVYTAFLAFGGRTLMGNLGDLQWLLWVLPAMVGSVLIGRSIRKYSMLHS